MNQWNTAYVVAAATSAAEFAASTKWLHDPNLVSEIRKYSVSLSRLVEMNRQRMLNPKSKIPPTAQDVSGLLYAGEPPSAQNTHLFVWCKGGIWHFRIHEPLPPDQPDSAGHIEISNTNWVIYRGVRRIAEGEVNAK